jgi:hypothetical protein
VLSGIELALVAAALLVGLTGAWSPCGFSMVETIGPTGHSGGRRTTLAACATFALGAVAGGAFTFGALGALGSLVHGAGDRSAYLVAAGIAAAAAAGEARAMRIVPQVRRQLPEDWRRLMPMPVAAGLYGVLLGLGFTTFVLTLGVWALGGISVALGDPQLGLLVGVAFGVGRALPVVLMAPLIERPAGVRMVELMAERPGILRGFRFGDALALLACAAVLGVAEPAQARSVLAAPGSNPSVAGADVAWQGSDGAAFLRRGGETIRLPGSSPALGGPYIAVRVKGGIRLLSRRTLQRVRGFPASRVSALAVSGGWLVYRTRRPGGPDRLVARRTSGRGGARTFSSLRRPAQLGRPGLWGALVVYAVSGRGTSRIKAYRLGTGRRRTLRRARRVLYTNPSPRGAWLLYVRTTRTRQQLIIDRPGRRARVLYSIAATSRRDRGYAPGRSPHRRRPIDLRRSSRVLWSTALGASNAYLTRLRFSRGAPVGVVLRIPR